MSKRRSGLMARAMMLSDAASTQMSPSQGTTAHPTRMTGFAIARPVLLQECKVISIKGAREQDFSCLTMLLSRTIAREEVDEQLALSCYVTILMGAGT
eukprot:5267828-Amphidinium_carterae.1